MYIESPEGKPDSVTPYLLIFSECCKMFLINSQITIGVNVCLFHLPQSSLYNNMIQNKRASQADVKYD